MSSYRPASSRRRSAPSAGCLGALGAVLVIGMVIAGVAFSVAGATYHKHWVTCTVTDKDRGYDSKSGSSNYRIYTQECDTLTNVDSWINGKHNSSNLFGMIQPGHRYKFLIVGYRMGIGSHMPNILQVQPLTATDR